MPRVTVVIPCYNPGEVLRATLGSVLAQTMSDLEVVVVDDGSTEDLGWVDAHDDQRVRRIRQPNRGVSVARNVGVDAARADLVAFLDQDDLWEPAKLATQLDALDEAPDAVWSCSEFTWEWSDHQLPGTYPTPITYVGLLHDQIVLMSSLVVRRSAYAAVGGQDPLLVLAGDQDLAYRLARIYGSPALARGALVRYRLHGTNSSRDYRLGARERLELARRYEADARRRGDHEVAAAARAGRRRTDELYGHQAVDAAREDLRRGDRRGAMSHLGYGARRSVKVVGLALVAAAGARTTEARARAPRSGGPTGG